VADDGPSPSQAVVALASLGGAFWELIRFARNPYVYVTSIISTYIVGTFLGLGSFIVSSVLAVFDIGVGALGFVRVSLLSGLDTLIRPAFAVIAAVQSALITAVSAAGPAAPLVVAAFGGGALLLSWEVAKRLPGIAWKLYQSIPGT